MSQKRCLLHTLLLVYAWPVPASVSLGLWARTRTVWSNLRVQDDRFWNCRFAQSRSRPRSQLQNKDTGLDFSLCDTSRVLKEIIHALLRQLDISSAMHGFGFRVQGVGWRVNRAELSGVSQTVLPNGHRSSISTYTGCSYERQYTRESLSTLLTIGNVHVSSYITVLLNLGFDYLDQ